VVEVCDSSQLHLLIYLYTFGGMSYEQQQQLVQAFLWNELGASAADGRSVGEGKTPVFHITNNETQAQEDEADEAEKDAHLETIIKIIV
jgi:hypothetical protein